MLDIASGAPVELDAVQPPVAPYRYWPVRARKSAWKAKDGAWSTDCYTNSEYLCDFTQRDLDEIRELIQEAKAFLQAVDERLADVPPQYAMALDWRDTP